VLLNLRRTVVGTFCTPTSKNLRYSTYLYALAVQRFLFRSLALRTCTRLLFNASFFARSLALSLVSMYVVVCCYYCRRRYEAYCVACPNKFFSNFNVVFILSSFVSLQVKLCCSTRNGICASCKNIHQHMN